MRVHWNVITASTPLFLGIKDVEDIDQAMVSVLQMMGVSYQPLASSPRTRRLGRE